MLGTLSRRAAIAAASLAFAAGCSGNSPSLSPGQSPLGPGQSSSLTRHSQIAPPGYRLVRGSAVEGSYLVPLVAHQSNLPHVWPDKKKKRKEVMFVADPQHNQVLMYNPKIANPSPEGSITTGIDYPFGVAVDKAKSLYVANLLGGSPDIGSITVYPHGSTSPSLTITTGCDNPYGIAVDSAGDIFAANLGNNTLVAYKPGATSPYESISFPANSQALGVGVDGNDNIWIGSDSNNTVYELPAGSTTLQNANLSGLSGTINVAFGPKDVMYVSNYGGSNVTVYAYGTTSPMTTITNGIGSANNGNGPTLSGFTATGGYFQSNQGLNVVGYKAGQTSPFSTITGIPDPRGIASTPLVAK
jgi:hypothetical protein